MSPRSAFTLIELLVVIAIISILAVVVVVTLNPVELLRQSRDSNRISDLATLTTALSIYNTDQSGSSGFSLGSSNAIFVSIPDGAATSTLGDQCQSLGLPLTPSNYSYQCPASATYRMVNTNGWIPVNFSSISAGTPFGSLPTDPINNSSSHLYYTYATNGSQFEVTAVLESQKYAAGGSSDVISTDGGPLASVYEKGSKLGLEPLDYADNTLVGYWPLNEGTGTIAYDWSGNNATGSWQGTATGTNGFYSTGARVSPYAGTFDGASTYVNIPLVDGGTVNTSAMTFTAWIYSTASQAAYAALAFSRASMQPIGMNYASTSNFLGYTWNNGGSSTYGWGSGLSIPTGQWSFVAVVLSPANTVLYLGTSGGGLTSSTNAVANITQALNGALNIGYDSIAPSRHFLGFMNNIRIYNRALSNAQIAALYTGGK